MITDFILYWKEQADHQNDVAFQFFGYFVVFNYLYNYNCYHNKSRCNNIRDGAICEVCSERKQFCFLLTRGEINKLKRNGFNPFTILNAESEMVKKPVDDRNTIDYENINREEDYARQVKNVFHNIYGIRCNLFHGRKELQCNQRNLQLVTEATQVLKHFIEIYIETHKGNRY